MDKYHAFELGLAFGRGLLFIKQTGAESLATDGLEWITIKPHGKDAEGYRHVQVDTDTKTIVKRSMAVDSDLCMSAEKLEVWNKYGCKLIEMIGNDDVNNRYLENFSVLLKC